MLDSNQQTEWNLLHDALVLKAFTRQRLGQFREPRGNGQGSRENVPPEESSVLEGRDQPSAIRTDLARSSGVEVAEEFAQGLARLPVPHSHGPLRVSCHQSQAIREKP